MAPVCHSGKITIHTHYDTWRTTGRNVCMCVRYIYRASCLFRLMTMRHIKPMRRSHSTWRILMGHDSFLLYYVPLARTLTDAQECVKRHGIRLYIVLDHVKQDLKCLHPPIPMPTRGYQRRVRHHVGHLGVTWLIHMCDVTDSYVWQDSFICVV